MIWNHKPLDEIYLSHKVSQLNAVLTDAQCMSLAYQAAWQGCGLVSTNPLVGAVAVDSKHKFLIFNLKKKVQWTIKLSFINLLKNKKTELRTNKSSILIDQK